jgi:hypothetical protein
MTTGLACNGFNKLALSLGIFIIRSSPCFDILLTNFICIDIHVPVSIYKAMYICVCVYSFIYYVTQWHMMKNSTIIGIVVAMAVGVVITGSSLPAVLAQGNMTAGGGGNVTAGGGDIVQQLKSAAVRAELIDNKKMFIIACEPSMTDPDTQCVVANLEMR